MADVPLMSNPMTTAGDLTTGGASGAPSRLALGSALQHLRVNSGATALEFADPPAGGSGGDLLPSIGDPPAFSGTADCDFRGAANLGNYTAVGPSAGTVTLHETTTSVNKYELTASGLLVQAGHSQAAEFRADYTLPDTQSMVLAVFPNRPQGGDNMNIFLRLNDNDTSSTSGNYFTAMIEQDSAEWVVQGNSSADATGTEFTGQEMEISHLILFRIVRDDTTYSAWVSQDGGTWTFLYRQTSAPATYSNVWFGIGGTSSGQTYMPVINVPFVVEAFGGDAFHPW